MCQWVILVSDFKPVICCKHARAPGWYHHWILRSYQCCTWPLTCGRQLRLNSAPSVPSDRERLHEFRYGVYHMLISALPSIAPRLDKLRNGTMQVLLVSSRCGDSCHWSYCTYAAVKCVVCKACQRIRWMLLFHTISSNDPLASEKAAIHRCAGLFACGPSLRRANLAKIWGHDIKHALASCFQLLYKDLEDISKGLSWISSTPGNLIMFAHRNSTDGRYKKQSVSKTLRSVLGVETSVLRPPSDPPLKQAKVAVGWCVEIVLLRFFFENLRSLIQEHNSDNRQCFAAL